MKFGRLAILGAFLGLIMISGCVHPDGKDGIGIMFDKQPLLLEDTVYFNGAAVGKVTDMQVGKANVTRVNFLPDDQFRNQVADNLVFYVSNGRLQIAKIRNFGDRLENGDVMCGFSSRSAFYWFRLKHALGDTAMAAAERAAFLAGQFQG